jgi:O-antigen ligase
MIELLTGTLIGTAWLAALIFIGRFILTTWFRRTAGVLTMAFLSSAFGVLTLALLTTLFGRDWPGREGARLAVYLSINVVLWTSVYLMVRDQHRARSHR